MGHILGLSFLGMVQTLTKLKKKVRVNDPLHIGAVFRLGRLDMTDQKLNHLSFLQSV